MHRNISSCHCNCWLFLRAQEQFIMTSNLQHIPHTSTYHTPPLITHLHISHTSTYPHTTHLPSTYHTPPTSTYHTPPHSPALYSWHQLPQVVRRENNMRWQHLGAYHHSNNAPHPASNNHTMYTHDCVQSGRVLEVGGAKLSVYV